MTSQMADNPLLGMIVDRSSFDEADEFSLGVGKDFMTVAEEHSLSDSGGDGGVVMKNGKVRRKLRWKPPTFRKKKISAPSSNMSVISALTNKSTTTSRSNTTNKSFLTTFSRRSINSFHTFHSTETPVVNNSATKPRKAFPLPRPNYPDTFEGMYSTIDNNGHYPPKQPGSPDKLIRVSEVAVQRSSTLPSRLDDTPQSPGGENTFVAHDSHGTASVYSDPFEFLDSPAPPAKKALARPPRVLFRSKKKETRPLSPSMASVSENSAYSEMKARNTATTVASSSSRPSLSSSISMEREQSILPALSSDDYEEDRRVVLSVPSPSGTRQDFTDDAFHGDEAAACSAQSPNTALQENQSPASFNRTSQTQNSPSGAKSKLPIGKPPTVPISKLPGNSTIRTSIDLLPTRQTAHRPYNRPVDTITGPNDQIICMTEGTEGMEAQKISPSATPLSSIDARRSPISLDGDDGAFFEAEHNLRAIHDMAAEHLAHGEYVEAIEVFEEILRGQQERYGHNHYRVGTALHNLGIVHLKSGDYQKAIEICSQAVQVRREALVPNHPDVAVSLAQLGVAHLECQQYEEALKAFRDALMIRRTFLGPRHPKCSKILNNIGCALYSMEELEGSRLAFEEALDIQRETLRMLPTSDEIQESTSLQSNQILLSIASTLCNLGSIRLRWGQFEEAELALEEALLVSLVLVQ